MPQSNYKLGTRMKQSSITHSKALPRSGNFQTDYGLANLTLKTKTKTKNEGQIICKVEQEPITEELKEM